MLKAILFDLDGTLLDNSLDTFASPYLQAIAQYLGQRLPGKDILPAILRGIRVMDANAGSSHSNKQMFAEVVCPAIGIQAGELDQLLEAFYASEFPKLQTLTRRLPDARPLLTWTLQRGLQVAIATGMQGPQAAIEHRLGWAGVPVTDFTYALLTTWDNTHASKPHPAYYQEVLAHLGRQADECLMVGDDWNHDIHPATSVGIVSYWIAPPEQVRQSDTTRLAGQGGLAELFAWLISAAG